MSHRGQVNSFPQTDGETVMNNRRRGSLTLIVWWSVSFWVRSNILAKHQRGKGWGGEVSFLFFVAADVILGVWVGHRGAALKSKYLPLILSGFRLGCGPQRVSVSKGQTSIFISLPQPETNHRMQGSLCSVKGSLCTYVCGTYVIKLCAFV